MIGIWSIGTMASGAGGRLADPILNRICAELAGPVPLGEDFVLQPPGFLRAISDKKPQLGAAALPVYFSTNSALGH